MRGPQAYRAPENRGCAPGGFTCLELIWPDAFTFYLPIDRRFRIDISCPDIDDCLQFQASPLNRDFRGLRRTKRSASNEQAIPSDRMVRRQRHPHRHRGDAIDPFLSRHIFKSRHHRRHTPRSIAASCHIRPRAPHTQRMVRFAGRPVGHPLHNREMQRIRVRRPPECVMCFSCTVVSTFTRVSSRSGQCSRSTAVTPVCLSSSAGFSSPAR